MANPVDIKIVELPNFPALTGGERLTGVDIAGTNKNATTQQLKEFIGAFAPIMANTWGEGFPPVNITTQAQLNQFIGAALAGGVTPPQPLNAYWIAKDTNELPSLADFQAGNVIPITAGQTSTSYDLTTLTTDKWLFLAEPSTEPVKTYKYASQLDQELLGSSGQFAAGIVITGGLRVYASNYPTSNTENPIILKTTA